MVDLAQSKQAAPSKTEQAIKRIYKYQFGDDMEEVERYGFNESKVQDYLASTVDSWIGTVKTVSGHLEGNEEQDLLTVDDTWLKLAQLMWTKHRKAFRNERKSPFEDKNAKKWISLA